MGQLSYNGRPIPAFQSMADACAELAPTEPLYILHPDGVTKAARAFLTGFPGETMFAVKANHTAPMLDLLWQAGIRRFDVASIGEVRLIAAKFPEAKMSFMAPVRTHGAALEAITNYGVTDFSIDGWEELDKFVAETGLDKNRELAQRLRLFVRLIVPAKDAGIELNSKFGAHSQESAALMRKIADKGAQPALTFHVGTLYRNPQTYARAIAIAFATARAADIKLSVLDVGGGFPVPYPGIDAPPLGEYFWAIRNGLKEHAAGESVELLCEPGRALVAEGLSVLTQVILRRDDRLFLNDGIYHSLSEFNLPDWTARYPLQAFTKRAGKVEEVKGITQPFAVYGPTCDSLDMLKDIRTERPIMIDLPVAIRSGDWISFGMMGAYSAALRTSFNGFYSDAYAIVTGR